MNGSQGPKLSALVVAHNEGQQLTECLERLSFADELVVVPVSYTHLTLPTKA